MTSSGTKTHLLVQDIGIVVLSIILAILLARTGAFEILLTATSGMRLIGSFIAGACFTSIFTTAPAIVALGEIAQTQPLWETALVGAFGALLGDLFIFRFVRDRLSAHVMTMLEDAAGWRRFHTFMRTRGFRWLTFVVGGLIIASPIPDEVGIALMGLSKANLRVFIPFSYAANFAGIYLIGLAARALAA